MEWIIILLVLTYSSQSIFSICLASVASERFSKTTEPIATKLGTTSYSYLLLKWKPNTPKMGERGYLKTKNKKWEKQENM